MEFDQILDCLNVLCISINILSVLYIKYLNKKFKKSHNINLLSKDNKHNRTEYAWYHTLDVNSACIFRPSETISKFNLIYKN